MKKFALIVAGGSGIRMGMEVPKQFLVLAGKPLLMHTIETFASYDPDIEIIIVLPSSQIAYWDELCHQHGFRHKLNVVQGGPFRFFSVKNGLDSITEEGIVFIHDGVRPLVTFETIRRCYEAAREKGNAIPVVPVSESVRWLGDQGNEILDRNRVRLVQTPQTFRVSLIKKAYDLPFDEKFTDDASVLENAGHEIYLTEGNRENIKITWPEDMETAERFLMNTFR